MILIFNVKNNYNISTNYKCIRYLLIFVHTGEQTIFNESQGTNRLCV